jgi:hypothetical protein
MRRAGGAWAVMLCVAASGCLHNPFSHVAIHAPPDPKPSHSVGGFGNAFGNSLDVEAAPGLYVESVLFERTVGDPLINREIWARDTTSLTPQTRVLLEENGLRVAVIGGNLTPQFQKMLESGEGAVSPQALTFGSRTEAVVPTVGPIPTCEYRVQTELSAERQTKKLLGANGGFQIQPVRMPDGRVKLRCEPQVQHGERQDFIRPAADATGFTLQSEMPSERYPTLGFEVMLGAGEYLVIGWPAADEGENHSLGSALFCVDGKGETRQRILVIRAGWRGETPGDLPVRKQGVQSIAAQVGKK